MYWNLNVSVTFARGRRPTPRAVIPARDGRRAVPVVSGDTREHGHLHVHGPIRVVHGTVVRGDQSSAVWKP